MSPPSLPDQLRALGKSIRSFGTCAMAAVRSRVNEIRDRGEARRAARYRKKRPHIYGPQTPSIPPEVHRRVAAAVNSEDPTSEAKVSAQHVRRRILATPMKVSAKSHSKMFQAISRGLTRVDDLNRRDQQQLDEKLVEQLYLDFYSSTPKMESGKKEGKSKTRPSPAAIGLNDKVKTRVIGKDLEPVSNISPVNESGRDESSDSSEEYFSATDVSSESDTNVVGKDPLFSDTPTVDPAKTEGTLNSGEQTPENSKGGTRVIGRVVIPDFCNPLIGECTQEERKCNLRQWSPLKPTKVLGGTCSTQTQIIPKDAPSMLSSPPILEPGSNKSTSGEETGGIRVSSENESTFISNDGPFPFSSTPILKSGKLQWASSFNVHTGRVTVTEVSTRGRSPAIEECPLRHDKSKPWGIHKRNVSIGTPILELAPLPVPPDRAEIPGVKRSFETQTLPYPDKVKVPMKTKLRNFLVSSTVSVGGALHHGLAIASRRVVPKNTGRIHSLNSAEGYKLEWVRTKEAKKRLKKTMREEAKKAKEDEKKQVKAAKKAKKNVTWSGCVQDKYGSISLTTDVM